MWAIVVSNESHKSVFSAALENFVPKRIRLRIFGEELPALQWLKSNWVKILLWPPEAYECIAPKGAILFWAGLWIEANYRSLHLWASGSKESGRLVKLLQTLSPFAPILHPTLYIAAHLITILMVAFTGKQQGAWLLGQKSLDSTRTSVGDMLKGR